MEVAGKPAVVSNLFFLSSFFFGETWNVFAVWNAGVVMARLNIPILESLCDAGTSVLRVVVYELYAGLRVCVSEPQEPGNQ